MLRGYVLAYTVPPDSPHWITPEKIMADYKEAFPNSIIYFSYGTVEIILPEGQDITGKRKTTKKQDAWLKMRAEVNFINDTLTVEWPPVDAKKP